MIYFQTLNNNKIHQPVDALIRRPDRGFRNGNRAHRDFRLRTPYPECSTWVKATPVQRGRLRQQRKRADRRQVISAQLHEDLRRRPDEGAEEHQQNRLASSEWLVQRADQA